jgi:cytochrome c
VRPVVLPASAVIVLALTLWSCGRHDGIAAEEATGGSVKRGERFLYVYNCGSCHLIPGIAEAKGTVGPPLRGFGNRVYISGSLINTPENLVRWIKDPQAIEAETAMPKLGVTDKQALDMAAYLYTLR